MPDVPRALEHLQAGSLRLCSMLREIMVWLPGVTLYILGAIAPALAIVLMTR
jgi:hypothetical protein